jgi:hypothetical protein
MQESALFAVLLKEHPYKNPYIADGSRQELVEPAVARHVRRRPFIRQCCNFQATAHERHDTGVALNFNLEQPSDEMELADDLTGAHPPGLPFPNCMLRVIALDRAVGSPERAEALARSHAPFDGR